MRYERNRATHILILYLNPNALKIQSFVGNYFRRHLFLRRTRVEIRFHRDLFSRMAENSRKREIFYLRKFVTLEYEIKKYFLLTVLIGA